MEGKIEKKENYQKVCLEKTSEMTQLSKNHHEQISKKN